MSQCLETQQVSVFECLWILFAVHHWVLCVPNSLHVLIFTFPRIFACKLVFVHICVWLPKSLFVPVCVCFYIFASLSLCIFLNFCVPVEACLRVSVFLYLGVSVLQCLCSWNCICLLPCTFCCWVPESVHFWGFVCDLVFTVILHLFSLVFANISVFVSWHCCDAVLSCSVTQYLSYSVLSSFSQGLYGCVLVSMHLFPRVRQWICFSYLLVLTLVLF